MISSKARRIYGFLVSNDEKLFRRILIAIFAGAFLIRLAFVFVIPNWQAPDEYPHFYYIKHIALTNTLPLSSPKFPNYESFQPPLYYLINAFIYKTLSHLDNTPYPTDVSLVETDRNSILVLLRIFSTILGILTIFLTYKLAESIFLRSDALILTVTGFVAFLPTFISNTTSVTNDSLANFLGAGILFSSLKVKNFKHLTILGILLGLGTLTKHSLLIFYPYIFILMLLKGMAPSEIFKKFFFIVVIALAISGWYFWRNFVVYGNVLALNPGVQNSLAAINFENFARIIRNINWSFWCAFGRIYELHLKPIYYLMFFLSPTLISIYGLSKFLYSLLSSNTKSNNLNLYVKYLMWGAILITLAALFYSFSYQQNCAWGKYLFPMLPAFSILFNIGLYEAVGKKVGKISMSVLILIFISVNFVILNRFISFWG